MNYFPNFESIINWKPYSFDGIHSPQTGVLCKWENGMIDYFNPNLHRCDNIRFVDANGPKPRKNHDNDIVGSGNDECAMITFLGF
jgi:hypothetical protein